MYVWYERMQEEGNNSVKMGLNGNTDNEKSSEHSKNPLQRMLLIDKEVREHVFHLLPISSLVVFKHNLEVKVG